MSELSHKDWMVKAAAIRFRDKAFIDGQFVAARSGRTFASINPATGETLAEVASCGEEDIGLAVAAARRSFETGVWSRAKPAHRKDVLFKLAQLLRENLHELALLESLDMGKLVNDAATVDVPGSAAIFQWYAEAIDKIYDEVAPAGPGDLVLVRREPLGVIGAVVPWNFPLDYGHLEMRAGTVRGQFGGIEAGRTVAFVGASSCGTGHGGWLACRCSERGAGAWRDSRSGARPSCGCRLLGLYRLNGGRQDVPAICRPVQHQTGMAGDGWQEPQPCVCRLPRSRRSGRHGSFRHFLQSGRSLFRKFASLGPAGHQGRVCGKACRAGFRHTTRRPPRPRFENGRDG